MRTAKLFLSALFVSCFFSVPVFAQQNSCTIESDGRVLLSGDEDVVSRCSIPLNAAQYTIEKFGYCDGQPDRANGFNNCYSLIDEPIYFDIQDAFTKQTTVKLPPPGSYSEYFVIADSVMHVSAFIEFANDNVADNIGMDGGNNRRYASTLFPRKSYTLDDCPYDPSVEDCSGSYYEVDTHNGSYAQPGRSRNVQTLFAAPEGDVEIPLLEIYWSSFNHPKFSSHMIDHLNVTYRLLTDSFEQATREGDVSKIMFHTGLDTPTVITGQETSAEATFDLELGGSLTFTKTPLTNMTEAGTNNALPDGDFWIPQNIMVGKNGLMPNITLSSE